MNQLISHKNIPLVGKHSKPIVTDFIYSDTSEPKPVVVFCHGYKGYKDWGAWQLMLKEIAKQGNFVVAFNFSHNGGTIEQPIDFPDLEAFGNDNFSKQQDDLQSVIDEVLSSEFKFASHVNVNSVTIIGHSRGGAMAMIKAAEESKITKVITLASVSTYETSFPKGEELKKWEKEGVRYITNGRTKQEMPLYYQLFENFKENKERFNGANAAAKLEVPHLIVHGTKDTSVTIDNAELIHSKSKKSEYFVLDTDHVFGAKQPWESSKMPEALEVTTKRIIEFLSSKN